MKLTVSVPNIWMYFVREKFVNKMFIVFITFSLAFIGVGVPRCIQMDRGTENTTIADFQTAFRDVYADRQGTPCVIYSASPHNQVLFANTCNLCSLMAIRGDVYC